mmetsp:Transcript_21578/g.54483  ORF Transcript_21578/g.54483 Transcript_21578/m.54483 type:complete len:244 (-) Transcript_21578:1819-2550(-)
MQSMFTAKGVSSELLTAFFSSPPDRSRVKLYLKKWDTAATARMTPLGTYSLRKMDAEAFACGYAILCASSIRFQKLDATPSVIRKNSPPTPAFLSSSARAASTVPWAMFVVCVKLSTIGSCPNCLIRGKFLTMFGRKRLSCSPYTWCGATAHVATEDLPCASRIIFSPIAFVLAYSCVNPPSASILLCTRSKSFSSSPSISQPSIRVDGELTSTRAFTPAASHAFSTFRAPSTFTCAYCACSK